MGSSPGAETASAIRYQPDERPPPLVSLGLGLQMALIQVGGIVLTPIIVVRAAGDGVPSGYLTWVLFAVLLVSGISTVLQVGRLGRFGSGHVLTMGTSGAFIAVSAAALTEGGPALLATLVATSALFQFVLAFRLSWLRRILTPTVAGIVIMLIAVTVMPIGYRMIGDVPDGASPAAAPVAFLATLAAVAGLGIRGSRLLRPWSIGIGLIAGCAVAAGFGILDLDPVREAAWVGVPTGGWPGLDLSFGVSFWTLLPAFVFVTLVGAIETLGDAIAIQRISWRKRRAPDYRVVEGAVAADGVGNLLSGFAGAVPNTTYSSSVSVIEITGVASRQVGIAVGVVLAGLAFLPKFAAFFMAVPNPVLAGLVLFVIGVLFTVGLRLVVGEGMDTTRAVIVGVSFWLGAAFEAGAVFGGRLDGVLGSLLDNGMTAGGLTAMLLVLFVEWTGPRPRRLQTALDDAAGPKLVELLQGEAVRRRWDAAAAARLVAAAEEALLTLTHRPDTIGGERPEARRLRFTARVGRRAAELEFVAAPSGQNLEDRMTLLSDRPEAPEESEISLRLLRHYASAVRHQKYHDVDIVTVEVAGPGGGGPAGAPG